MNESVSAVSGAPHVVMLVRNTIRFDTRVKKEAGALVDAGYRVTIVATRSRRVPETEVVDGAVVRRVHVVTRRARRFGRLAPTVLQLSAPVHAVLRHLDYLKAARPLLEELMPDVVHANDANTLLAGWWWSRRRRIPLVYDAHELEVERRPRSQIFARLVDRQVERLGIRAAAGSITVSGGIADLLARTYRVDRPIVVLNSPALETRDRKPSLDLRAAAGAGPGDVVVAYVGKVLERKIGIERLLEALALAGERFRLVLIGPPPTPAVRDRLGRRAVALGLGERVHFLDPLPHRDVPAALSTADCSVIPLQNVNPSYDLSLPNKLFDSLMAGLPVGVGRLTEMSRIVQGHRVGVVFDETDSASIAWALAQLEALAGGSDAGLAGRIRTLQEEVAWERQAQRLLGLYAAVAPTGVPLSP